MKTVGKITTVIGMVVFLLTCVVSVVYIGANVYAPNINAIVIQVSKAWSIISSASMGIMLCGLLTIIISEK